MIRNRYGGDKTVLNMLEALVAKGYQPTFVSDMDGVLADFDDRTDGWIEKHTQPGHYISLPEYRRGVEFINQVAEILGWENIYICSASPNMYADHDKLVWLARYLPKLHPENIMIVRVGTNKAVHMRNLITAHGKDANLAMLMDDYGKNLRQWWEAWNADPAEKVIASPTIKAKNPYNCKGYTSVPPYPIVEVT